jgi:deoxyadenosine/deoxycytidine kinase
MMKKFVVVAGNIGAGKSTLVRMMSERLNWHPYYEPVAENPYLEDFYLDMRTWSFHSQIYFLTDRLRTHLQLIGNPSSVIQDRSVYEDAEVFAHNLYIQGLMGERDYQTYQELYQVLTAFLPPPDLVIYLRASVATLLDRIAQRGRDYEQKIKPDYISQLNSLYKEWIDHFTLCPVLTVPTDDLNFVKRPDHFDLVVRKMDEKLTGKEEVVFEINKADKLS